MLWKDHKLIEEVKQLKLTIEVLKLELANLKKEKVFGRKFRNRFQNNYKYFPIIPPLRKMKLVPFPKTPLERFDHVIFELQNSFLKR